MENNPIHNSLKKCKYLGMNLNKQVNDLYNENYNALKREIVKDTSRWKDLPCSWIALPLKAS
jgi:hypothetical protein